MLHVGVFCAVVSVLAALWSPTGKGLTTWLSCVVFPCVLSLSQCVLVLIRIKGEVGAVKLV